MAVGRQVGWGEKGPRGGGVHLCLRVRVDVQNRETFFWPEERIGGEIGGKCGSSSSGSVKHLIHQRMTAVVNHLI